MYVYIYISMYVCMYVCIYIYIHIYNIVCNCTTCQRPDRSAEDLLKAHQEKQYIQTYIKETSNN